VNELSLFTGAGGAGAGVAVPGPVLRFVVSCRLPGLNDMLDWAKRHSNIYSKHKKQWTMFCGACARRGIGLKRIEFPVRVRVTWREPNRRRDPDNIHAGIKMIMDGLVQAGILKDDGWDEVAVIEHVMGAKGNGAEVELWRS
jgi:hypothetical protein